MAAVCCVLCGVPISRRPGEGWVKEFRAVYTGNDNWGDIRTSGVGFYNEIDRIAPVDPTKRYDDLNLESDLSIPINLRPATFGPIINLDPSLDTPLFWGFGFHAPCWDVLNESCSPRAEQILGLCLSMPFEDEGILDWGHDYGGAIEAKPRVYRDLSTRFDQTPIGSLLRSDPLNIPAIRHLTGLDPTFEKFGEPEETEPAQARWPLLEAGDSNSDPFNRLPPEILQAVILYLPSKDVGSVRLASRIFSNLSLTDTFWASRFDVGFEFQLVFEFKRVRPPSWKVAYDAVASLLQTDLGLINRQRIWRLAKQIGDLTSQMDEPCHGSPISCFFEQIGNKDSRTWLTASRDLKPPNWIFGGGCRALRIRLLEIPPGLEKLFVSFIQLSSGKFVSGFRFRSKCGREAQIGYSHPSQEQTLLIHSAQGFICGWNLAFQREGITAVSALMEDGTFTPWVGHHENVPKRRLFDGLMHIPVIKAEFDALKMVALSVPTTTEKPNERMSIRESCLWAPEIPPHHVCLDQSVKNYPYPLLPFSTVMFGGCDGEDLAHITEVVAWGFSGRSISGLQFHYTDSAKSRHFGLIGPYPSDEPTPSDGFRVAFSIDGPQGERISSVKAQFARGEIYGLKIQTNWGKEVRIPPTSVANFHFPWDVIQPSGNTIVGLYSVMEYGMITIGVMSINLV